MATERPVARQLTTTAGAKADPQFTPDGRDVMYLDAGRIQIANIERRDTRPLAVTAEFTVEFTEERRAVFDQAWRLLRDNFFDPAFRGVNWEASRERYGQRGGGRRHAGRTAARDEPDGRRPQRVAPGRVRAGRRSGGRPARPPLRPSRLRVVWPPARERGRAVGTRRGGRRRGPRTLRRGRERTRGRPGRQPGRGVVAHDRSAGGPVRGGCAGRRGARRGREARRIRRWRRASSIASGWRPTGNTC